ncbi:MAG: DUF2807 domain-containing protein [Bacteroidia bacterium]|nr:DUF2807 domain-containing protein [Bacteroidia bacterium]
MKQKFLSLILAIVSTLYVNAQDTTLSQLAPFTSVSIGSSAKVFLTQSPEHSVRVSSSTDLSDIRVEQGTLRINGKDIDEVYISMPVLKNVSINGKGAVIGQSAISGDDLDLQIGGEGKILLEVNVKSITADISGLGKIELSGTATSSEFNISGSGKVEAINLKTSTCTANISGLGKCSIDVTDELTTNISGHGTVSYKTKPLKLSENISGLGKSASYNSSEAADTTHFTFGTTELFLVEKNDPEKISKKKETRPIWAGIELGFNSYVNADGNFEVPPGYSGLELYQEKSVSFAMNLLQKNFELGKSNIWFFTGLGLSWNNYRFDNNITLQPTTPITTVADTNSARQYDKSKLVVTYLTAPLMFEFFSQREKKGAFHIGAGAIVGVRLGSHTKQKFEEDGQTNKPKVHDDFNLNPFRYGFRVAVGFGSFNIFADYYASTLFEDEKGPSLYPVNLGITLANF